ncbi:MAG: tRNA lysidine(34) synthetase TilS [Oscillospiraceae bacterium]|jgi:tRNA(Ile)-lysidine synthase|nr:tRNA lysidine(34) synthetase TilS [Oscillospiraceae bacterium]
MQRAKILKLLEEQKLISQSQTVIVAVSGGADSMVLLDFMNSIKEKKNINLMAAHVNHCLRGRESDDEEMLVRSWCDSHNISLHTIRANTKKAYESTGRSSLEDCARRIRYNFFADLSQKFNAKIATAHTLSDNVETFLLNLTRGSGVSGLASIRQIRNNIIRPFLRFNKQQILDYCKIYKVKFATDSSNFSYKYTRNKIRLGIVPKFKEINPSFEAAVSKAIAYVKEDNDFLYNLAESSLKMAEVERGFSRNILLEFENPVRSRAIALIVHKFFAVKPNESQIKQISHILYRGSGIVTISNKKRLIVNQGILRKIDQDKDVIPWQLPFSFLDFLTPDGKKIRMRMLTGGHVEFDTNLSKFSLLDLEKVGAGAVFRNRRRGDLFSAFGRNCTKSLKKFLNEEKVLIEDRPRLVILARGSDVLWVEGFGISQLVCVDSSSKILARISVSNRLDSKNSL